MQKKIVISMAVVALLLMGIMATSVLASNVTLAKNAVASNELQAIVKTDAVKQVTSVRELTAVSVDADDSLVGVIPDEDGTVPDVDVDSIRELVPDSYEETDVRVIQRTRFLLYTNDGKYVMWGYVGNGHFVGADNMGKRCWGIYGKGVFAGFYDGEFFWGKYRCGNWKAQGLFGLNCARGKYILFPSPSLTAAEP